jgi:hypothetical protein
MFEIKRTSFLNPLRLNLHWLDIYNTIEITSDPYGGFV